MMTKASLKELVVCKYVGCYRIYDDARILPCGNRTCFAHIDAMLVVQTDENNNTTTALKCHFCDELHALPTGGKQFPCDTHVALLLSMRNGAGDSSSSSNSETVASASTPATPTSSTKLATSTPQRLSRTMSEYFRMVEEDITRERELNEFKLKAYYDRLIGQLNVCKTTSSLNLGRKMTQVPTERPLSQNDMEKIELCDRVWEQVKGLEMELSSQCASSRLFDSPFAFDSVILRSERQRSELLHLCHLSSSSSHHNRLELLYRASRDGFAADRFHAKCDNRARTLTLIKTTNGCVFGGYTEAIWNKHSAYKRDDKAYLFSLVNKSRQPIRMPIKNAEYAIYCDEEYGPTFGCGHNIHVSSNSNVNMESYSSLGHSYAFSLATHRSSFLAGSFNFRTTEIEVFQLN